VAGTRSSECWSNIIRRWGAWQMATDLIGRRIGIPSTVNAIMGWMARREGGVFRGCGVAAAAGAGGDPQPSAPRFRSAPYRRPRPAGRLSPTRRPAAATSVKHSVSTQITYPLLLSVRRERTSSLMSQPPVMASSFRRFGLSARSWQSQRTPQLATYHITNTPPANTYLVHSRDGARSGRVHVAGGLDGLHGAERVALEGKET
jgi:hypothetical protein